MISRKEMRERLARERKAARMSTGLYGRHFQVCIAPKSPATALWLCTLDMVRTISAPPLSHHIRACPAFAAIGLYGTCSRNVCTISALVIFVYLIYQQIGFTFHNMIDKFFNQSLASISSNARVLEHNCGLTILQVSNTDLFRAPGWESQRPFSVPSKGNAADPVRSLQSSRNRAKREIRNIALNNKFTCFITLTLDPKKIDRYNADVVKKSFQNWLRNNSSRKGLQYLFVAEEHKDGAIHFHGLCNLGNMSILRAFSPYTGKPLFTDRGQEIYNLADWKFGYSTVIFIDEHYERTCNYLMKYFTKDYQKIFGKWYFSSRNLVRRPQIMLIDSLDYDEFLNDNPDAGVIPVYDDVRIACKTLSSNA